MIKLTFVAAAVASAFLLPPDAAAQTSHPGAGTWKLNIEKSILFPAPKSQTFSVVPDGDSIKVTTEGVSATGAPTSISYVGRYDGKDTPITGNPFVDMVSLKRSSDRVVQATFKKGGVLFSTAVREVSKDGRTMTVKSQFPQPLLYALAKGPSAKSSDPTMGTWELVVDKSRFAGPPMKSQSVTREPEGKGVKTMVESVNGAGTATKYEFFANYDRKDYPVTGATLFGTDAIALQRVDSRTTKAISKRGKEIISTQTNRVSQDGKTWTNDFVLYTVAVYDKE